MKKTFTILIAAIAAILMMTLPKMVWGQTYEYVLVNNISELSQGDVILIANSNSTGTQKALGAYASGNNCPAVNISISDNVISTLGSAQEVTLESKNANGYFTLKVGDNAYLYAANSSNGSKNYLKTTTNDNIYWEITINTSSYVAAIKDKTSSCNGRNCMKYNSNNGNPIFSCYSSGDNYLFVFKKQESTSNTPSLSVSQSLVAFGDDNTIDPQTPYSRTFDVTFANLTENLSISVPTNLSNAGVYVSQTSIATTDASPQTVTVYFDPEDVVTLSGNITVFNTADNLSQTVAVSGSSYDPASIVYYEKVTTNQTDWSGVYIVTYAAASSYEALTGVVNNLGTHAPVSVANDKIVSNNTVDAYAVTIVKTTGDKYSMQLGSQYLYAPASNNLYASNDFTSGSCEWTIEYNTTTDLVEIKNVTESTRLLQYNTGSPRFACYTGSQKNLTIFKYQGTVTLPLAAPVVTLEAGNGTITYTWADVANAQSYTLEWSTSSTFASDVHEVASATSGNVIPDLNNGTTYYVRVKAIGDGENYDNSDWSEIVWETPHAMSSVTITFKGNYLGATADYTQTVTSGVASNLEENKFTRDGFAFNGWNNESDGTGTSYTDGQSVTIKSDLTLYAQWAPLYTATVANSITNGTVAIVDGVNTTNTIIVTANTEVELTNTPAEGYVFDAWDVYKADDATTKVTVTNNRFNMPDYDVIVSATFTEPSSDTWVLTPLANLTPADVFVIVGTPNSGTNYYSVSNNSNPPAASSIEITNDQGVYKLSSEPATTIQWNISGNATDGYTFYPVESSTTWLNCSTTAGSKNNNCMTIGNGTGTTRNIFELDDDGYLITKDNYTTRYISYYGTDSQWRGYVNKDNNPAVMTFYKKVTNPVELTTPTLSPYTGNNNGWHLIASPVAYVTPIIDNGFLTSDPANYDLYRFNQSADAEWENHKVHNFNLVSGKGYLYANADDVTLCFTGQPYNGNGIVALSYYEDARFAGYNLIGNPYNNTAYLADSRDFYRMNDEGSGLIINTASDMGNAIAAFEGILVIADNENDNSVIFQTTDPSAVANTGNNNRLLNITVSQYQTNRDEAVIIDAASIRFDEGNQLSKFQLFDNSTKLYIPQNGNDFAVVRSDGHGEMPVNFKAKELGKYTISVKTEGIDMNYLHLIDRLTGEDIDLLVEDGYSFFASKTDIESRFILSFSANGYNLDADYTFAFQSGSDIIVSGEGELQIFDVMGRKVKTQYVSGVQTVNVNAQGVYIMKLNEKTQKIIVR